MATTYRTCPSSGLQFENNAEKLMRWHAVVGVLWLLVGGITALFVILTRWPAIKLLPADQFYLILTAVSYTHLDVYKRQTVDRSCQGGEPRRVQDIDAADEVPPHQRHPAEGRRSA